MEFNDKIRMILLCGALRDVGEKSHDRFTKRQIEDIRVKMEKIITSEKRMHNAFTDKMNGNLIDYQDLNGISDTELFFNKSYR